jgi:werner syndrome ATP-dependent helicase
LLLHNLHYTSNSLRFKQVKHSRTSWASYEKDFHELIKVYGGNKKALTSDDADGLSISSGASDTDSVSSYDVDGNQDDCDDGDINVMHSGNTGNHKKRRKLTIEFLENDVDVFQSADDLDGTDLSAISQFSTNNWSCLV